MRHYEFANLLVEKAPVNPQLQGVVDKATIMATLKNAGYEVQDQGNKITILTEIPDGENVGSYRASVMKDALALLQKQFLGAVYSNARKYGGLGGIEIPNSSSYVLVKDKKGKGGGSSGKLNETNLVEMLYGLIQTYGKINVTFVDKRGKKLGIKNCTDVSDASLNVAGRKKADLVLSSSTGSLPISLKKVNADTWESADTLFGPRAKEVLSNLQQQGAIKLQKINDPNGTYYKLNKEIVVEPTPEETMNAIFGSDLLNKGGVVIQTFQDEHFVTQDNNVTIECQYIIKSKEDIPEGHLMVWLIRNDKTRSNPLPGLRTLGSTLTRGIGSTGTKDVILVDRNGNLVQNPNRKG